MSDPATAFIITGALFPVLVFREGLVAPGEITEIPYSVSGLVVEKPTSGSRRIESDVRVLVRSKCSVLSTYVQTHGRSTSANPDRSIMTFLPRFFVLVFHIFVFLEDFSQCTRVVGIPAVGGWEWRGRKLQSALKYPQYRVFIQTLLAVCGIVDWIDSRTSGISHGSRLANDTKQRYERNTLERKMVRWGCKGA